MRRSLLNYVKFILCFVLVSMIIMFRNYYVSYNSGDIHPVTIADGHTSSFLVTKSATNSIRYPAAATFDSNSFPTFITIMTNNRLAYLKSLMESLSKVRGMEETELIFSHNFESIDITNFVRKSQNISKKTTQLFFPYRLQLYPDKFPGMKTSGLGFLHGVATAV